MNNIWIGTNWKMHKTLEEGMAYSKQLMEIADEVNSNVEIFIIPPYTSLWKIKEVLKASRLKLGAQNSHWEKQGAYTGEISPEMLSEIGLDIIELGHSERRQYYNETDIDINKKVHAVFSYDIRPLICIGENLKQKKYRTEVETVASQLKTCLFNVSPANVSKVLIAYEPVWAIGEKGDPANPEYVSYIHNHIRKVLKDSYGQIGEEIPILYGGSVNETNSMSYLKLPNVNGLFIGRAAWNIISFRRILAEVNCYVSTTR